MARRVEIELPVKNKKLIVMCGLPGIGKTTFVNKFKHMLNDQNTFIFSTDDYVQNLADQLGQSYDSTWKDTIGEATSVMNKSLRAAIVQGNDIIHDQTNMSSKKRRKILALFNDQYWKTCVVFMPPQTDEEKDIHMSYVHSREGKTISDDIMKSMLDRFEEPSTKEGFDDVYPIFLTGVFVPPTLAYTKGPPNWERYTKYLNRLNEW